MTKTWNSVNDFIEESEFSIGTYEIEAFYGDPDAQGTIKEGQEGYEYAYYYGKTTDITVLEGQTTQVELHAGLANAIVEIEYTDEFKNYFSNWSTTLQTAGATPVKLGGAEAMNYVSPGEVSITIDAEQQNGKTLVLTPGTFTAEAQHMYKMRYNIYNGEIDGIDKLIIEFDDNLETEPIEIDLSDDLMNAAAPVVTPAGFESGQNFANLSGTPFDGEIKFNVMARGTIKEANLTIISDTYKPSFLTEGKIDLCQATSTQQQDMETAGIKAIGFFKNPGQMAQLDLTSLCRSLPEGNHQFVFQIIDKYAQSNEPVDVTLASIPVEVKVTPLQAPFGEGYADIIVSYNGPDPTAPASNPFTFAANGDSAYEDCEIISIEKAPETRTEFPTHDYIYRISVPTADRDELPLRTYFNGNEMKDIRVNVPYEYPDYQVEFDPLATQIRLRTNFGDAVKNERFIHKLKVYVDDQKVPEGAITRSKNILTITGYAPSTSYSVKTTLLAADNPTSFGSETTITTEAALQIPNSDFAQTHTTININPINAGGQYKYMANTMQNHSSILVDEPVGWASINKKTCYEGSNPKNTWFMVPSTLSKVIEVSKEPEEVTVTEVTIRSVAYDHAGTLPALDNHGASVRAKYSRNKPTHWSDYAAGELFLGTYSFDGTEHRVDGINFEGRPASISFDYRYDPVGTEKGDVEITLLDLGNNIVSTKYETLSKAVTNTTVTVSLPDYEFGSKVGKIKVRFRSSNAEVPAAPVPEDIADVTNTTSLSGQTIATNQYKSLCVGSQLTISKVVLNY